MIGALRTQFELRRLTVKGGTIRVSIPAPNRFKKTAKDMPTTRFSRGKTLSCQCEFFSPTASGTDQPLRSS